MLRILKGKSRGSVGDMAVIIIGLLAMLTLLSYATAQTKDLNTNERLDIIVRSCLLKLESDGNMTDAETVQFESEVKDRILNAVDGNGNKAFDIKADTLTIDVTPGEYGEEVGIEIHGEIRTQSKRFGALFGMKAQSEEDYVPFSYTWKSTSKS